MKPRKCTHFLEQVTISISPLLFLATASSSQIPLSFLPWAPKLSSSVSLGIHFNLLNPLVARLCE